MMTVLLVMLVWQASYHGIESKQDNITPVTTSHMRHSLTSDDGLIKLEDQVRYLLFTVVCCGYPKESILHPNKQLKSLPIYVPERENMPY